MTNLFAVEVMHLLQDGVDARRVRVSQESETSGPARRVAHDGAGINVTESAHVVLETLYRP